MGPTAVPDDAAVTGSAGTSEAPTAAGTSATSAVSAPSAGTSGTVSSTGTDAPASSSGVRAGAVVWLPSPNGPVSRTTWSAATRVLPVLVRVKPTTALPGAKGTSEGRKSTVRSLTAIPAVSSPLTRACTRTPSRRSTETPVAPASETSEVTIAPEWSPAAASAGTVSVKGTSTRSPGASSTAEVASCTQVPRSVEAVPVGSTSSSPASVVNPSAA
ncbi:hypothetical protein JD78_01574 [Modestobacter roseus]|uniref:Uncharacterized protein n=1 Tax=Modestobacter roseus TaxID=1181884 RepID=A0A562IPY1_9ACTN|nr:hypothetical protein [Modestobacter roseus]TWH73051.1 hypothetical protein JD78_01574 [Modestobacter roseus]